METNEYIHVRPCCALCDNLYDKEKCPLYNVYNSANSYGDETFDNEAKYKVCCPSFALDEKLEAKGGEEQPITEQMKGANWYRNNAWHDKREKPEYKEGGNNQIIVYGQTSIGRGCSVCDLIADGVIYTPLNHKEYKWGECPFTKWAYIDDLIPTEGYNEK